MAPSNAGKLEVNVAYSLKTHGIDASSILSGKNPKNNLMHDLVSGTKENVLETLLIYNERKGGNTEMDLVLPVQITMVMDDGKSSLKYSLVFLCQVEYLCNVFHSSLWHILARFKHG